MRGLFSIGLLVICLQVLGQSRHWSEEINHVSRYLGPNALPVEPMDDARTDTLLQLFQGGQFHYSAGDRTFNLWSSFKAPLFTDRVSIHLWMVPWERFSLSEQVVEERNQWDSSRSGTSVGDLNVATKIILWKETQKRPAITGVINLRTASGGNLAQARFIDAPGYTFKVGAGKTYNVVPGFIKGWRWYANAGLRVYQTRRNNAPQNDLFVYGIGWDIDGARWRLSQALTGYIGYFDQGDKPMVYRLDWRSMSNGLWDLQVGYQWGSRDFNYHTFSAGLILNFS